MRVGPVRAGRGPSSPVPAPRSPGVALVRPGRRCAPSNRSGPSGTERSALPAFAAAPATRRGSRAPASCRRACLLHSGQRPPILGRATPADSRNAGRATAGSGNRRPVTVDLPCGEPAPAVRPAARPAGRRHPARGSRHRAKARLPKSARAECRLSTRGTLSWSSPDGPWPGLDGGGLAARRGPRARAVRPRRRRQRRTACPRPRG
jgi:hypothetical protein